MKYTVKYTTQFKKDLKNSQKQHKDISKLTAFIEMISNGETLNPKYKLHRLSGKYKDSLECHIEPDWLLIYKIYEDIQVILLDRIGSHSELF